MSSVVAVIGSIITNFLSNDLYEGRLTLRQRCKIRKFKKNINKWVRKYCNNHDGSILTSGLFEVYLNNYHPIEKIFVNIAGDENSVPKTTFIDSQFAFFEDSVNAEKMLSPMDEYVFKELFSNLYDKIELFYKKGLPLNLKYIASLIENSNSQLQINLQNNQNEIIKKMEHLFKGSDQKIDDICERLKHEDELSDPSDIWNIYQFLSREIMYGKISDVEGVLPIIKSKNKSLQIGLEFLIQVISKDQIFDKEWKVIDQSIDDDRIHSDLIEKIIFILYMKDDRKSLSKIGIRNIDLYNIANNISINTFDDLFNIEMNRDSDCYFYEFNLHRNYQNHNWLVKRILLIEIIKLRAGNSLQYIRKQLDSPENILDEILWLDQKETELFIGLVKQNSDISVLISELDNLRDRVKDLSDILHERYFLICFHVRLMQSQDKALSYYECIPDELKQKGIIKMLKMQVELDSGIIDEENLIKTCIEEDRYVLFRNYLLYLIHTENNITCAKEIIEKYKFILDKELSILVIYSRLIEKLESNEQAGNLLQKYESRYGEKLEYWITRLSICYEDDLLEHISDKWLNDKFKPESRENISDFIRLLAQHKKFEYVLRGLHRLEKMDALELDMKKIKALALSQTYHEIEALEIYKSLYEIGEKTDQVIYGLLFLSVKNKRSVPKGIIEIAKTSTNPDILRLAAECVSVEESNRLIKRALFRSKIEDIEIFGQYLQMHTQRNLLRSTAIDRVDIDTVVYLTGKLDGSKLVYCVHDKGILPADYFTWEDAIHIVVESAIKLKLFNKKVGDDVEIDTVAYVISEIASIESFFFSVCMDKMVLSGNAKVIPTSSEDDEEFNLEEFSRQVKKVIGNDTENPKWLERYKDLSLFPVTLYYCVPFVRVTYTKLISALIEDPSVLYRELLGKEYSNSTGYILSSAAMVSLERIGYVPSESCKDIIISSTLKKVVSEDSDRAISEHKKETVAVMGVKNEELYLVETSESEKNRIMSDAVRLKDYSDYFPEEVNRDDLVLKEDKEFDLKEVLGIADYDAISIAKKKEMILVSAEVTVSAVCTFDGVNVSFSCIADFLVKNCERWDLLIEYTRRMFEYRFMIPITINTIRFLNREYLAGSNDEKDRILDKWESILSIPIDDKKYRLQLAGYFKEIFCQLQEVERLTPICSMIMLAVLKYSGYSMQIDVSDEGEIVTTYIKEE